MTTKTVALVGLAEQAKVLRGALLQGMPALLIGETGTGKTTLVQQVADKLKRGMIRVNLDGGTSPDELVGRYQLKDGQTYFEEGVIPRAMRSGSILLLDELNAALPEVLFVIHALLERPPRLFIPETGQDIHAEDGFGIVATMNPSHEYAGTKAVNPALYSRFGVVLRFQALKGRDLWEALASHVPAASLPLVAEVASLLETAHALRQTEEITTRLTLREGIAALLLATDGLTQEEALKWAILAKLDDEERKTFVAKLTPLALPTGAKEAKDVTELWTMAQAYKRTKPSC